MKTLKVIFIVFMIFHFYNTAFSTARNYTRNFSKADTIKRARKIKIKLQPPRQLSPTEIAYSDCRFVNKYSLAQRLKHYPFSKNVKILAVSYPCQNRPNAYIHIDGDTSKPKPDTDYLKYNLHIKNGVLDKTSLIEIKTISSRQINYLTKLIYNTDFKKKSDTEPAYSNGGCFNPRNALLFFDSSGKIFDYIEICFECQVEESKSQKIFIGVDCNQRFDLLKQFFIDAGVNYGTTEK